MKEPILSSERGVRDYKSVLYRKKRAKAKGGGGMQEPEWMPRSCQLGSEAESVPAHCETLIDPRSRAGAFQHCSMQTDL